MPSHPPPSPHRPIAPHQVWKQLSIEQQKQAHNTLIDLLHHALMSSPSPSNLENPQNESLDQQ